MTTPRIDAWTPDAFTWQRGIALQGRIPYAPGSTITVDGEATQRDIAPAVDEFKQWLASWPGIRSVGARRSPAKPSTAGRQRDVHEEGRALDAMIATPDTPAGNAAGDALAAFLVENADRLGVQGVIWRHREWYASRVGAAWEDYDGADGHTSHPHIELSPSVAGETREAMRARLAAVVAAPARPAGRAGWGIGLLGAASLGALAWMAARLWRRR